MNNVVIIDDDYDLCLLLKNILEDSTVTVKFVHSIKTAKQLLAALKADIIFLDNNLPDGQGIDYIKEIKLISPQALLIIITAEDYSKDKAIRDGADIFLEKPLIPSNIRGALQRFMERS